MCAKFHAFLPLHFYDLCYPEPKYCLDECTAQLDQTEDSTRIWGVEVAERVEGLSLIARMRGYCISRLNESVVADRRDVIDCVVHFLVIDRALWDTI